MNKQKKVCGISVAAFIDLWNSAEIRAQVASALDVTPHVATIAASRLRNKGHKLKRFSTGNRTPVARLKYINDRIARARQTLSKLEAERNRLMGAN